MKVFVLTAYDPFEPAGGSWVVNVYSSKDKAKAAKHECQKQEQKKQDKTSANKFLIEEHEVL